MKREDLEQALELLDDDLIERAGNRTGSRRGNGFRYLAIAACLVLVLTGVWGLERKNAASNDMTAQGTADLARMECAPMADDAFYKDTDSKSEFVYASASEVLRGAADNRTYSPEGMYYGLGSDSEDRLTAFGCEVSYTVEQESQLINTIRYDADWTASLEEPGTRESIFAREDGTDKTVSYIVGQSVSRISEGEGYISGSLELAAGEVVFVLPEGNGEIQSILEDPWVLRETIEGEEGQEYTVRWEIPGFSYQGEVKYGEVCQRTYICVDGGEAAGDPHTSETEYTMELNRPFIYAVRDQEGEVLFIGVCMDPA